MILQYFSIAQTNLFFLATGGEGCIFEKWLLMLEMD